MLFVGLIFTKLCCLLRKVKNSEEWGYMPEGHSYIPEKYVYMLEAHIHMLEEQGYLPEEVGLFSGLVF